jgi:hypothetical protein
VDGPPDFLSYLVTGPLTSVTERRWFGAPYVRFLPLLTIGVVCYQKGAVLGRALRARLERLAELFWERGHEAEVPGFLGRLAAARLSEYGSEPESFLDFLMATEYKKLGINWFSHDPLKRRRTDMQKLPLQDAAPMAKQYVLEGIGFGSAFPEITERMWRQMYEEAPDAHDWARARRLGVVSSEQFHPMPLEEMEQTVLMEVAIYVSTYFPHLVEPLGLRLS